MLLLLLRFPVAAALLLLLLLRIVAESVESILGNRRLTNGRRGGREAQRIAVLHSAAVQAALIAFVPVFFC